jgi:hypothetical protein
VKLTKNSFKKRIYKLKYLEQELEELVELNNMGKAQFMVAIREVHAKLNVYDEFLDKPYTQNSSKDISQDEDIESVSKEVTTSSQKACSNNSIKSLYRKIVFKIHPDKLEKNTSQEDKELCIKKFDKLTTAYNNNDYTSLFVVADELNIHIDTFEKEWFIMLDDKIQKTFNAVSDTKSSMFVIYEASSEDKRADIIQEFIRSRGWTGNHAGIKKSRKDIGHPGQSIAWGRKLKK